MSIPLALPIALCILFSLVPITYGGFRKIDEKALAKYVKKAGLPLPPPLREALLRRITNSERWSFIGGGIGLGLGVIVSMILGWAGKDEFGSILVMLGVPLGAGFGGAAAVLTGRYDLSPAAPRMARTQQTEVADYLTRTEILSARMAPVAAVVAMVTGSAVLLLVPRPAAATIGELVPAYRMALGLGVACVIVTVLALLVSEIVTRRAMDRPQRAQSELELAWDDVCRADSLRILVSNPLSMGVVSIFAAMMMVGSAVTNPAVRAGAMEQTLWVGFGFTAFAMLLLVALLLPGFIATLNGARRHVLTRLWSNTEFGAGRERNHADR